MIRVVLDTNILISGVLHIGKPARLIDLALEGKLGIVSSIQMINEFKRVGAQLLILLPVSGIIRLCN